MKLIISVTKCLILTICYANGQNLMADSSSSNVFPIIQKDLTLKFPDDHGSHDEYRIEWWYLTANLKDQNENPVGLQWTLFRAASEPKNSKSDWASSQVWMGHAAITTKDTHLFKEKIARDGVLQANVTTKPFEAWIDDWYLNGETWEQLSVTAAGENFKYALELKASGPIVRHGDAGRSIKSSSGQASAYYSQPFFQANGWVEYNKEKIFVTGSAWADHEWSSQFISDTQEGWDWFSLNFNTGEKLMLFQVRENEKNHFYSGTWIDTNGAYENIDSSQIFITPDKSKSFAGYYTNWIVKVKKFSIDVNIRPVNSSSRMDTVYPYWEGPITFSGSHSGNGYLEMTGYLD